MAFALKLLSVFTSLSLGLYAAGPATPTYTVTGTFTRSPTSTFTPLPTPNGLHVSGACIINLVAGQDSIPGYLGDGGLASASRMNTPTHIAFDSQGNYYFCDSGNHLIRKVNTSGTITLYAGLVTAGVPTYGYNGDGITAVGAALYYPKGIAFDAADNLYIADTFNNRIRKVDRITGMISTVLGNGTAAWSADGVPYGSPIAFPESVVFDAFGAFYYIENASRIRKASGGSVSTYAGTTAPGYNGDGIPATSAQLKPACIAFSPSWDLYVADSWNDRIRKINSSGTISTVFGNGVPGSAGVGGPATATQLSETTGVGFDAYGDMYVNDQANVRVLKMDSSGNSSLVAGATGATSTQGNSGPAALAGTGAGYNFVFDSTGRMYFCSSGCHVIRTVDACGNPTATATATFTVTYTRSSSPTPTFTASPTRSPTPTLTPTPTFSSTLSPSPTLSFSSSPTAAILNTATYSPTSTPLVPYTATHTPSSTPVTANTATFTPTSTPLIANTATFTSSATPIITNTATFTSTSTPLLPNTATDTRTSTPVVPNTATNTTTATPVVPNTPTFSTTVTPFIPYTATITLTFTPLIPNTATTSPTVTPVIPNTATFSSTVTPVLPNTATSTHTATPANPFTATPTSSPSPAQTPSFSDGPPELIELVMAPNPVQGESGTLAYKMKGRVTHVRVSLYSSAYQLSSNRNLPAPGLEGWNQGTVSLAGLPNGVWFVRMKVESEKGLSTKAAKFCIAR